MKLRETLVVLWLLCWTHPIRGAPLSPELVVQSGHSRSVELVSFSPDGQLLASAAKDHQVILWDVASALQVRTFQLPQASIKLAAFAADGRKLIAIGSGIWVMDAVSGTVTNLAEKIWPSAQTFEPKHELAAYSEGATVTVFDLRAGRARRSFEVPTKVVGALAMSPDGKTLAVGAGAKMLVLGNGKGGEWVYGRPDRTVSLHDIRSGRLLQSFKTSATHCPALAFSPDGRLLAGASYNETRFANVVTNAAVTVWDTKTGQPVHQLGWTPGDAVPSALGFSSDGDLLGGAISVGIMRSEGRVRLWNMRQGEALPDLVFDGTGSSTISFQPGGPILASAGLNSTIVLWDLSQSRLFQKLRPRTGDVKSVFVRPESLELLVMGDWAGQGFNMKRGFQSRLWQERFYGPGCLSRSGKRFANLLSPKGEVELTIRVWDWETGREYFSLPRLPIGTGYGQPTLSPDDRALACTVRKDNDFKSCTVQIWDLEKKTLRCSWKDQFTALSMTFSPDGRHLYTRALHDKKYVSRIMDVSSGRVLETMNGNESGLSYDFTKDGTWMQLGGLERRLGDFGEQISLWNPQQRQPQKRLESATNLTVTSFQNSPMGQYIAGIEMFSGRRIAVWEQSTGKLLFVREAHSDKINSVAFSPDDRLLITASDDDTSKIWNTRTGDLMATFVPVDHNEWVLVTPDNYYTASKRALSGVAFRLGNRAYRFEQFDLQFNRPDIVLQRLGYATPTLVANYAGAYKARAAKAGASGIAELIPSEPPVAAFDRTGLNLSTTNRHIRLRVSARSPSHRLANWRLLVNGVPTSVPPLAPKAARSPVSAREDIPLELGNGKNVIRCSVLDERGIESLQDTIEVSYLGPFNPRRLFVLAVGVSEYKPPVQKLKLDFAAKDARDFAAFWSSQTNAFEAVEVRTLVDTNATREAIVKARDFLAQSAVDDVALVFLAGHGFLDAQENYYFGTVEIEPESPSERGLDYAAIEGLLENIPARQKILLLDTCHAGEVENEYAARLQAALFADLRQGSGTHVITSSSSFGVALDSLARKNLENSPFTGAVLEGLKGKRLDGKRRTGLLVSEFRGALIKRVRELTDDFQKPTSRRENQDNDFDLLAR
jgi:WD40 repeat protein